MTMQGKEWQAIQVQVWTYLASKEGIGKGFTLVQIKDLWQRVQEFMFKDDQTPQFITNKNVVSQRFMDV